MPNDNAIKFGILKCRDLVELYYGARMVVSIIENEFTPTATPAPMLPLDPRRIRLEVVIANTAGSAQSVNIGSNSAVQQGNAISYQVLPDASYQFERSFLDDMEGVTLELWMQAPGGGAIFISTRETFLTPIPVDEMP